MNAHPPRSDHSRASREGLFLGNPVFLHDFRFARRAPVRAIIVVFLLFLAAIAAALAVKVFLDRARLAAKPYAIPAAEAVQTVVGNIHYFLPLIPLALFIRRVNRRIECGMLSDLALTPLRPEAILAGWLGAGLVWGSLAIAAAFIPVMELSSPLLGAESLVETLAILLHYALHMLETWSALLVGLPFALYLTLSHRRRVNAMLLTGVFIVGLMFLVQNTAYLLTLLVCGNFRNRGVWSEHLIRAGLSLGLLGGMGLLSLMKAGARLSGYYIERLEGGSGGGAGRSRHDGAAMTPWFRSPMFRQLWGGGQWRAPILWLGFFALVCVAAGLRTLHDKAIFDAGYVIIVLLLYAPIMDFSLARFPQLWERALRRRLDAAPADDAPLDVMTGLVVFKAIYYPLFLLNLLACILAAGMSFGMGQWVAGMGFFRSYHYALLLPISLFLVMMLAHLHGSYCMLGRNNGGAAAVKRRMRAVVGGCVAGMGLAGFGLDQAFIHSNSTTSVWAWILTLSLAVVFPLAAWLNMMIERRLRGMLFV